jgi:4-hydroxybenzoate polyprenyltransferase
MDWNAFIVPVVMILVELIKLKLKDRTWLPHIACSLGVILGIIYAVLAKADMFLHVVEGLKYGAAAAVIYDALKPLFIKRTNQDL